MMIHFEFCSSYNGLFRLSWWSNIVLLILSVLNDIS